MNNLETPNPIKEKQISKTSKVEDQPFLKGGYFLVGNTPPENVFISEEFTEEQLMIREMVIDFCIKNVQEPFFKRGRELEVTRPEDKEQLIAIMKRAGELGLCGISIPEEYGGMEIDFNTGIIFAEAIASGFSFATTIGAQTSIGSLPIYLYGNEEQKQKYLPRIASGEFIASYALTEPTAGSDANSGKSKAILSEDGSEYILNGQKVWITNGGFADVFVVFAKIEDDKDLSAFIVERTFEGLTIGQEEKKMGIKGSSTVQLFFDNCKIPVGNLLGGRQAGFKMALNILNTGRIKIAAGGVGGGKFSLEKGIDYALERKQFGQPIGNFGAIKYKLAEITMRTFAMDAAVYRAGRNVDLKMEVFKSQGQSTTSAKLNAVREFAIECAILKTKGSNLACFVTDESMQIYGGMGYSAETGLEMAYRDARITKIYEGTNDVNRMLSLAELTKRGLQTKEIDLVNAGKKIPMFLVKQFFPFKKNNEERLVQAFKNVFLLISGAAGKKLKKKMVDEQQIILNLSDILAEVYVAESVLLKIRKLKNQKPVDAIHFSMQEKMMQLYLYDALDVVHKSAKNAIESFAEGFEKRSLKYMTRKMLGSFSINPKQIRREIADYVLEKKKYPF